MQLLQQNSKSKKSYNKDFYKNLIFEINSRELPIENISKIINTYQVFDDERNNCTKYRLNVTINPYCTNALVNPLTEIKDSNNAIVNNTARLNLLKTIKTGYTYNCGYDIFDNHYLRVDSFKTGTTLNDFLGVNQQNIVSIQESIRKNIYEENGWLYFVNRSKINNVKMFPNKLPCEKIDLFPTRDYYTFNYFNNNGVIEQNWDYFLSYPFENKTNHILVTGNGDINGLPIFNFTTGQTVENGRYLEIQVPYNHNLKQGDIIKFKNEFFDYKKTYLVYDIGNINRENKDNFIIIDIDKYSDLRSGVFLNNLLNTRIVKVINNVESNYYLRVFRKIPNFKFETNELTEDNINDKILNNDVDFNNENYQLSFAKNIYNDQLQQIQYIDDIDVNLLKDNLGRNLSELYFTIIKKNIDSDKNSHNNIFTKITSGFNELVGVDGFTNVRVLNSNNQNELPLENNLTTTGSTLCGENKFIGDIVEYNKSNVKEYVLEDVYHRFNTIQRETKNKTFYYHSLSNDSFVYTGTTIQESNEGYFYKPHYKIPIKNFNNNIKRGELIEIEPCETEPFISGLTIDGEVKLLTQYNNYDFKYLLLKVNNYNKFVDLDRIRISYLNYKTTVNIRLKGDINDNILIPFDPTFFGDIQNLNQFDYKFQKYGSIDIPNNADDIGGGVVLWREMMNEGDFDNNSDFKEEFIFTNGRLYLNKNINFYLKRQDPFGDYGLKTTVFPSDVYGIEQDIIIEKNKYEKTNTIC